MGKLTLSKSTYIKGLQCHKFLFLYKNHYNLRDKLSAQKLSTFKRGTNVGLLAQKLFANGINLMPKSHFQYDLTVENTRKCVEDNMPVLYEPAFKFNDVLIFLDILVKQNDGWHAYEVKSSRNISETYINDAALQYYVLKGAGINITDFTLIYINEDYVFNEKLDIHKLFSFKSVLNEVIEKHTGVEYNIKEQKQMLMQNSIPNIDIGIHCYKPYDCEFIGYCWQNILKKNSVFDLEFLSVEQKFELFNNGIDSIDKLLSHNSLNEADKLNLQCIRNKSEYVNKEALIEYFSFAQNPLCYLDILSFKPAVPFVEGAKPYQNFNYLISALYEEDGNEEHIFCLCKPEFGSIEVLLSFLSDVTKKFKAVVVFDKVNLLYVISECDESMLSGIDLAKIFGIKEIFEKGFYVSYKLRGSIDFEEVLIRLGLKNYFADKSKINNSYEASDCYLQLLQSYNYKSEEELKQKLIHYSNENLKYIKRLYELIKKKVG